MSDFKVPKGYKCWCHQCGEPPFNKKTLVEVETQPSLEESQLPSSSRKIEVPGVGFQTIDELTKHTRDVHKVWKG